MTSSAYRGVCYLPRASRWENLRRKSSRSVMHEANACKSFIDKFFLFVRVVLVIQQIFRSLLDKHSKTDRYPKCHALPTLLLQPFCSPLPKPGLSPAEAPTAPLLRRSQPALPAQHGTAPCTTPPRPPASRLNVAPTSLPVTCT